MFDTIHHVAIIGSDYQRSKHFYVDQLGFKAARLRRIEKGFSKVADRAWF